MSASESAGSLLRAHSDHPDPGVALREALTEIGRQLPPLRATPGDLIGMVWIAADPGAFHPSRREIDLAYREVFAGARPPIEIRRVDQAGIAVEARCRSPPPPSGEPVWGSFVLGDLAGQYSPRLQVPSVAAVFEDWTRRGDAFRRGFPGLDLSYGPGASDRLDLYRPSGVTRPPVWIFIHGGYWQACTKEQHAHFAAGMLGAGFAVANLEYPLAGPGVDLRTIADRVRVAIRFLAREADALDIAKDDLHVAGHSAGGHLAAMAALDEAGPGMRSALLLSGLFDLAPLAALPMGRVLGLTSPDAVAVLSPMSFQPPPGLKVAIAVGGLESDEFKRQSADIAVRWGAKPPLVVADRNHFDLLDGLIAGELLDFAVATARV